MIMVGQEDYRVTIPDQYNRWLLSEDRDMDREVESDLAEVEGVLDSQQDLVIGNDKQFNWNYYLGYEICKLQGFRVFSQ